MPAYRLVRVVNATRQSVVAERCRIAQGFVRTVFGLHLLPRLEADEGLLLPGATTIDTAFMSYPIDLVFLDRSGAVTRVVHDMRPWRIVLGGHGGKDCLELAAGTAARSSTQVGDLVELTDLPVSEP